MTTDPDELPEEDQPQPTAEPESDEATDAPSEKADDQESGNPYVEIAEPDPLPKMRVGDMRRILNDPSNPLYDEVLKSVNEAFKPLVDSQLNWSKMLNSGTLKALSNANFAASKATEDLLKSIGPKIDTSIFTRLQSESTRKMLEGLRPNIELGDQFSKVAANLAAQSNRPPLVEFPPRDLPSLGTVEVFEPAEDDHQVDDLTLADVSEEAQRQADQFDQALNALASISSSLIEANARTATEAQRLIEVEEKAEARFTAQQSQANKDRRRSIRYFWIATVIATLSLIGVTWTLIETID